MTNERLRAAITEAGLTPQQLSDRLEVSPKTVERWITNGRVPHRTHRISASQILGKDEVFLWPSTETDPRTRSATRAEFVDLHPSRGALPATTWATLIDNSRESIDLLAFAASFLNDTVPDFQARIADRAAHGVRIRLLFGDPASDAVMRRGQEEGIDDMMSGRCTLTWTYLKPLLQNHRGIEARKHATTLYASLFRFDDSLLANPHTFGAPASQSPIMHINRIPGGRLFAHYMASFDRVWEDATPA